MGNLAPFKVQASGTLQLPPRHRPLPPKHLSTLRLGPLSLPFSPLVTVFQPLLIAVTLVFLKWES